MKDEYAWACCTGKGAPTPAVDFCPGGTRLDRRFALGKDCVDDEGNVISSGYANDHECVRDGAVAVRASVTCGDIFNDAEKKYKKIAGKDADIARSFAKYYSLLGGGECCVEETKMRETACSICPKGKLYDASQDDVCEDEGAVGQTIYSHTSCSSLKTKLQKCCISSTAQCNICAGAGTFIPENEAFVECIMFDGSTNLNVRNRHECILAGGFATKPVSCNDLQLFAQKVEESDVVSKIQGEGLCSSYIDAADKGGANCCKNRHSECNICSNMNDFNGKAVGGFICEGWDKKKDPPILSGLIGTTLTEESSCLDAGGTPKYLTCESIKPYIRFTQGSTCSALKNLVSQFCCSDTPPECPICADKAIVNHERFAYAFCDLDTEDETYSMGECIHKGGKATPVTCAAAEFRGIISKAETECSFRTFKARDGGSECCGDANNAPQQCNICPEGKLFNPLNMPMAPGVDTGDSNCGQVLPYIIHTNSCADNKATFANCCDDQRSSKCDICSTTSGGSLKVMTEASIEKCYRGDGLDITDTLDFMGRNRASCVAAFGAGDGMKTCGGIQQEMDAFVKTKDFKSMSNDWKAKTCAAQRFASARGGEQCCTKPMKTCDICNGNGVFDGEAIGGFECFKDGTQIDARTKLECYNAGGESHDVSCGHLLKYHYFPNSDEICQSSQFELGYRCCGRPKKARFVVKVEKLTDLPLLTLTDAQAPLLAQSVHFAMAEMSWRRHEFWKSQWLM